MVFKLSSSRSGTLLVELLMIVIGINIALWFESLADDFKDQEIEQDYLQGLRDDLQTDLSNLNMMIEQNESKVGFFTSIIPKLDSFAGQPPEQQSQMVFAPASYSFFRPANFTYTSMQESGDFHLLSEPDTKRGILRLVSQYKQIDQLQNNYIQAMDAEYIPLVMANFDLINGKIADPALLTNQVFRNFFAFALEETRQRVKVLKKSQQEANNLLVEIEAQIH